MVSKFPNYCPRVPIVLQTFNIYLACMKYPIWKLPKTIGIVLVNPKWTSVERNVKFFCSPFRSPAFRFPVEYVYCILKSVLFWVILREVRPFSLISKKVQCKKKLFNEIPIFPYNLIQLFTCNALSHTEFRRVTVKGIKIEISKLHTFKLFTYSIEGGVRALSWGRGGKPINDGD